MKPPLAEQADASRSPWFSTRARGYHQWLKAHKARITRRYAKASLKQGQEPENTDKKHRGYET